MLRLDFAYLFLVVSRLSKCEWTPEDFGGHSREFHAVGASTNWDSIFNQPQHVFRHRRDSASTKDGSSDQEIRQFIESHKAAAKSLTENLENLHKDEWFYMAMRIKSFDSLRKKTELKNYTLDRIRDVIGIRLTLQTVSEVLKIKSILENSPEINIDIIETRCYGFCNSMINYTEGGYRRIHLLVKVRPFDKWAEIQLGTPYCNVWSDWNHDFLYKGTFSTSKNESIREYMVRVSEYLYQLDRQRDAMVACPSSLVATNAKDALDEFVYEFLGRPKNLCFFWRDIFLEKLNIPTSNSAIPTNPVYHLSVLSLLVALFI